MFTVALYLGEVCLLESKSRYNFSPEGTWIGTFTVSESERVILLNNKAQIIVSSLLN